MKRRILLAVILAAASFAVPAARPHGQNGGTGSPTCTPHTLGCPGIGFIVGEPTGISVKHFLTRDTALDAGAAWSLLEKSRFHLHADYLFHNFDILKREFEVNEGELPLYYGVGVRMRFEDDARFGVRLVAGVSYRFEEAPLDLFFEVAPIMDLVPETKLNGNVGFGLRFWFR